MVEFRPDIFVEDEGNKCIIIFSGKSAGRNIFADDICNYIYNKYQLRLDQLAFIQFIKEIIRNIYDHANGSGSIHLTEIENEIHFLIRDNNTEPVDFNLVVQWGYSTKDKREWKISGLGMRIIVSIAFENKNFMDVVIKTDAGIIYSGKFMKK